MGIGELIADRIRERGPLTVAAFMDLALYHQEFGYYARAAQRSGRAGDFFTSVDVGPLFGELLSQQVAEMAKILAATAGEGSRSFDLVEAGAGNGRLSADIMRALARDHPGVYTRTSLHLVDSSRQARVAQRQVLGEVASRLTSSSDQIPEFEGVLIANEVLDAMPVHQVVMQDEGLREVYVDVGSADCGLSTREGPPSTPALQAYLNEVGARLQPGWKVEVGLRAVDWIRDVSRQLRRGFIVLIDYGHEARDLYSPSHATGTLTTYARHRASGPDAASGPPVWLSDPGHQDITAHVDFTAVRRAAEAEGLTALGLLDQTYFLLGILTSSDLPDVFNSLKTRLALKTLLLPGGLGSTMKVMILGKDVATPPLVGCSYRVRMT